MNVFEPTGPEEIQYSGRMIEVVTQRMTNGAKNVDFEWGQRAPGVRLIAINDTGKILLTKEFRYELDDYDYRLPGGKVSDTLEEWHRIEAAGTLDATAEQKVIEEAKEEAGLLVNAVSLVEVVPDGATFKWDLRYYQTRDFTVAEQELEHGEDITTGWYSPAEIKELVKKKRISEGRSVYILMPYIL